MADFGYRFVAAAGESVTEGDSMALPLLQLDSKSIPKADTFSGKDEDWSDWKFVCELCGATWSGGHHGSSVYTW